MRKWIAGVLVALALPATAVASNVLHGTTSQHRKVSLVLAHHQIRQFSIHFVVTCPNGSQWIEHDYGFAPMPVSNRHFYVTAISTDGQAAATIHGTVRRLKITGTFDGTDIINNQRCDSGLVTFVVPR